jgi:hypothetical protein
MPMANGRRNLMPMGPEADIDGRRNWRLEADNAFVDRLQTEPTPMAADGYMNGK